MNIQDLKEGWRVPLQTGNYGLYEEGAFENGELVIWDLDMGIYVPLEMIDWYKISKEPNCIIKD